MTYFISLALMAAGLVLLTWTFVAALRLRTESNEVPVSGITPALSPMRSTLGSPAMHSREMAGSEVDNDWYQLQCGASRGVRYAPDMGGFTEVPLQLHDAYDNRMYVRKRIWVN